jgi:outer membrane immunogenic protein
MAKPRRIGRSDPFSHWARDFAATRDAFLVSVARRQQQEQSSTIIVRQLSGAVMKKLAVGIAAFAALIGTPALAADMAVKAAPAPVFSWTGFYVGANAGYGWNGSSVSYTPNDINAFLSTCGSQRGNGTCVPPANLDISGAVAGGQIGYNWQINANWLVGLETDLDWSGIKGESAPSNFILNSYGPAAFFATQEISWFGTLRARAGILPVNPLLIYATGGLAYGGVKESAFMPAPAFGLGSNSNGGFSYSCGTFSGQANCFTGSANQIRAGWTLGAGGEYVVASNVTLRVEYLYVDLGHLGGINSVATSTLANPGTAPSSFTANFNNASFNVVRGGVNLKF